MFVLIDLTERVKPWQIFNAHFSKKKEMYYYYYYSLSNQNIGKILYNSWELYIVCHMIFSEELDIWFQTLIISVQTKSKGKNTRKSW